jgi:hypothetical protein
MFPLIPVLQKPAEEYQALIERHSHHWEKSEAFWLLKPNEHAIEFACNSAFLSDADTSEVPWKTHYTNEEMDKLTWVREFFENDVTIAKTYLALGVPIGRIVNPVYINMPLCRDKLKAGWRVTSDRGTDSAMPPGIHGRLMVRIWRFTVAEGVRVLASAPVQQRQAFAWAMHDAFLFLRPFRDGNGRTARLALQSIRRELSLLPVYIDKEQRNIHRERAKFFNKELFVPYLRSKFSIEA